MYKKVESIPQASFLLNSLRSVGYSEEAAIADIIDNSISAHASTIKIQFDWDNKTISISDDGEGMDQEDLYKNMGLGVFSLSGERQNDDLGRFGMGMKTAAISLGKKMTVITKKSGVISNASWNLNEIPNIGWNLCVTEDIDYNNLFSINPDHGTVILIEDLDRIIDENNINKSKTKFFNIIKKVAIHIGIVFHRYISEDNLQIYVNNNQVQSWDPFVVYNVATQELNEEVCWDSSYTKKTVIQPYVLPHKTKFASEAEYELAEGPKGWNQHQGIYLYRNKRLIIYGTWFDIIRKEPAFNLARIKVDIFSDADDEWNIDIKKSTASLPVYVKDQMFRAVSVCTEASAKVYNSRGIQEKGSSNSNLGFVWSQRKSNGHYSYFLNKQHTLLKDIKGKLGTDDQQKLKVYLSLIENFAPFMQNGIVETLNNNDSERTLEKDVDLSNIKNFVEVCKHNGFSLDEIETTLLDIPGYKYLKNEILSMIKEYKNG